MSSFDELVKRHRPMIYRIVFRVLKNAPDAEDVTQETFVRALTRLDQFRGNSKFSTWLVRIALNCAYMKLRTSRRIQNNSVELEALSVADTLRVREPNPEQLYALHERASLMRTLLDRLNRSDRQVLLLRVTRELPIQQIALIFKRLGNRGKNEIVSSETAIARRICE